MSSKRKGAHQASGRWQQQHTRFLPLLALILLGLLLRLIRLDFQPLWWDEGYSVWFAGHSLADMLRLTAADIHPPLYYALLHGWSLPLDLAPTTLRLFGVLASLPAIPLAYLLGRDLGDRRTALFAAAIVAINPLALFYSQEIRMYGLAATFSLAALWTGWRWAQTNAPRRFGLAYALSILGGMFTLYTFALLPLAQFLWILWAARKRLRQWLAAVVPAALLYLPWLLYAGPKLLDYVAYKIVKDNDTPLSLPPYLGRHLSAFLSGHLEGDLAPLWPWALLILLPPLLALLLRPPASLHPTAYLTFTLTLPLAVGFVQQLNAPFIPDRFERVLLFAAPALWLLLALGLRQLGRISPPAALLTGLLLLAANAASLGAFYTTPRYADRDYRPLLDTIRRNAAAADTIFAIFPWQIGYYWSYVDDGPAAELTPAEAWNDEVSARLDTLLAQGAVWFPEHLSLGGELETAAEAHLGQNSYQILNRWFGEETRLTAWAQARPELVEGSGTAEKVELETPVGWQIGTHLNAAALTADYSTSPARFFFDLDWTAETPFNSADFSFSLWLTGPQGFRWAQRHVNPFAAEPMRLAMTLPAGTPPGEYDLWAAILDHDLNPTPLAGPNPAPQAWLGNIILPATRSAQVWPDFPAEIGGDGIDFLGHDRATTPILTGDDLHLSLYWRPDAALMADYFVFVQLLDGDGAVAAGIEAPPLPWFSTSRWTPGQALRSQHYLRIPADLPAGEYRLIAGLFEPGAGARVTWNSRDLIELGEVSIGARTHDFAPPSPQVSLNLSLAGGHRLVGYDLVAGDRENSPVNLTLYWQAAGPTDVRYSVFVHLLNETDDILDQSDAEPGQGAHPATSWLAGEFVSDAHTLALPADLSSAPFRLGLGLYDPRTGQRLPFLDEAGEIVADHLVLPLGQ